MKRTTQQILLAVAGVLATYVPVMIPFLPSQSVDVVEMVVWWWAASGAFLVAALVDQTAEWMEYEQGVGNPCRRIREEASKYYWSNK